MRYGFWRILEREPMSNTAKQLALAESGKKIPSTADTEEKNRRRCLLWRTVRRRRQIFWRQNRPNREAAAGKIPESMTDRLLLDGKRICAMADGDGAWLPLTRGRILETIDSGGGNRQSDVAVLSALLRKPARTLRRCGGFGTEKRRRQVVLTQRQSAFQSARAIVAALKTGLAQTRIDPTLPVDWRHGREGGYENDEADYLDLLIPRVKAGLIRAVVENAVVAGHWTGTGIVHIVDKMRT